jgi:hypothetical protein
MIDRHLASRTPILCPAGTPWLFPRRDGLGPVGSNQLSYRLTRRVRRETGLAVHTHLFRHLAVMVWLEANPGSYVSCRTRSTRSSRSVSHGPVGGRASTRSNRQATRARIRLPESRRCAPPFGHQHPRWSSTARP